MHLYILKNLPVTFACQYNGYSILIVILKTLETNYLKLEDE